MNRRLMLSQTGEEICLSIVTGEPSKARAKRFWMTQDQALHAAHRLMSFASSGHNGIEKIAEENTQ